MGLSEVSNILWRERQLLDLLLFKLEEEQLLLAAGKARWLGHATREVEAVLEQIRQAELFRAVEVHAAAKELGLGPNPSLRELVEAAPAPWNTILAEHRSSFAAAVTEITALAKLNRALLARGHKATEDALAWLGENQAVETYSPAGLAPAKRGGARLVNEAM